MYDEGEVFMRDLGGGAATITHIKLQAKLSILFQLKSSKYLNQLKRFLIEA